MRYLYLTAFLSLLFTSCAPLRVVRLEPVPDQVDRYLYGNGVAIETVGGAEVRTSFFDADKDVVIFHVEVENKGDQTFDYDPAGATQTGPYGNSFRVLNPEVELLSLDLAEIRRQRTNRVLAITGAAVAVAGAVYLATDGGDGGAVANNIEQASGGQIASDLTFILADAATAVALSRSRDVTQDPDALPGYSEREFWLDYALRRTTIDPGQMAIGKLVFTRAAVEGVFQLRFPVGDGEARVDFDQRVFR